MSFPSPDPSTITYRSAAQFIAEYAINIGGPQKKICCLVLLKVLNIAACRVPASGF
jgi:hypothetical protein